MSDAQEKPQIDAALTRLMRASASRPLRHEFLVETWLGWWLYDHAYDNWLGREGVEPALQRLLLWLPWRDGPAEFDVPNGVMRPLLDEITADG